MTSRIEARKIIEKLREGVPPRHGVERYAVGNEKLLVGIGAMLEEDIGEMGIIRFVNGSWGAGKTHFFGRSARWLMTRVVWSPMSNWAKTARR